MNWKPISTAPTDRPVFVRAVDLSTRSASDALPGITAWTTYHPSAGFSICDIRTTVQWDADAVPPPPVIKESLTTAMDDDLDEPLGPACSMNNPECESCQ